MYTRFTCALRARPGLSKYITRITLRNHIMELDYGKILWNYIKNKYYRVCTEVHYGKYITRNYITESHYGIILLNYFMVSHY